jgi:hypothetical protein
VLLGAIAGVFFWWVVVVVIEGKDCITNMLQERRIEMVAKKTFLFNLTDRESVPAFS